LRNRHRFGANDVESVEVTTIPFGLRMADPEPASMLAAKFSIPYAIAAALVLGVTEVTAFTAPALGDPRIRALARRVHVTADPDMSPRRVDHPTARVRIVLSDGRAIEETTTMPRGDAANPVAADEIVAKFVSLATPVLGADRAERVVDTVHESDRLKDVRDLTVLLA